MKIQFTGEVEVDAESYDDALEFLAEELNSTMKYLDKGGEDQVVADVLCSLQFKQTKDA